MDEHKQTPSPREPGGGHDGRRDDHQPDAADLRRLGEEGGPIGLRVGRNPANLGDEVPDEADLTTPEPALQPAEM